MIDLAKATRYIAVAQFSKITRDEWKASHPTYTLPPDEWKDYALLKVLDMLRLSTKNKKIAIHPFQHEEEVTGLDFSKLQDTDVIFVVGHGDHSGLYAMGPKSREGMKRLVAILTKDGNLQRLRNGKKIVIALLSCRAGLGLHSFLSHSLNKNIAVRTIVCGAQGFTFGSIRTSTNAANETLIRGIPWYMEYPNSITQSDAENATTAREGKTITFAAKQAEIDEFVRIKKLIEDEFRNITNKLTSTNVTDALDEIDRKHHTLWHGALDAQFEHYAVAKKKSNLEFDMWYSNITEGYLWADSKKVTAAQATAHIDTELSPTDDGLRSTR